VAISTSRLEADADAVQRGDIDEPAQVLDLLVERRAELGWRHRKGDDFGSFGDPADRRELVVVGLLLGRNAHVERDHIESARVAAALDRGIDVGQDLRGLELIGVLEHRQLNAGVLQVRQPFEGHGKREVKKTFRCGSYEHR
jgi:hypothetical protein